MSEKQKILIVENQFWQFKKIIRFVSNSDNYQAVPNSPDQDEFVKFIDYVRIWVNEVYNLSYREVAFAKIMDTINNNKIDLILMDHILGGANHCLTGIDLAYEINAKLQMEGGDILPVVFLSKTSPEDKKREKSYFTALGKKSKGIIEYEFLTETYKWVQKGYFGDDILNPEYFAENVIPAIGKIIGEAEEVRFWYKLNEILESITNDSPYIQIKTQFQYVLSDKRYWDLTTIFKEKVIDYYSSTKKNLDTLLNLKPYESSL